MFDNQLRNPQAVTLFHRNLQRWYAAFGRHGLPWRNTADPYAIYVSEVMLQQTQVKTVLERYYFPFLERFPTLSALAAASRKDVLSAWQGLGYYNRAVNLHEAAKHCKGILPSDPEALAALPGIGRNTAHAVAALAFRKPVAVMEANVKRVLSRIFALTAPSNTELWERAAQLLDTKNPFDYNQAMMDIGALVCKKRAPDCKSCPAQGLCAGKFSPESYPAPKAKKAVPVRKKHIVVRRDGQGKYHAAPRTGKFLGGLYHFIEQEQSPQGALQHLGHIRQQYSHFTLEADIWLEPCKRGKGGYSYSQLVKLPFSNAEHKILALLEPLEAANKRAV